MSEICNIIKEISELSPKNRTVILNLLSGKYDTEEFPTIEEYLNEARYDAKIICPICGSVNVVKNGKRKDGVQKYYCKDCSHHFVLSSNSLLFHSKKNLTTWIKFINCMIDDMTLERSAEVCGIHKNTAFNWRHKILDAYAEMNCNTELNGVIQMDEAYFRASFKGNHKKNKTFKMSRKAYKRGHKSKPEKKHKDHIRKRGLSLEQFCVPCAVMPNGVSVAKVCKLGAASSAGLEKVFENHIAEGSCIVSDSFNAYPSFAVKMKSNLVQIDPDRYTSGNFNIQRVNYFHSMMKKLLNYKFNGVSTKYLNNYIELCRINMVAKSSRESKLNIVLSLINTLLKNVRICDILSKEMLPVLI